MSITVSRNWVTLMQCSCCRSVVVVVVRLFSSKNESETTQHAARRGAERRGAARSATADPVWTQFTRVLVSTLYIYIYIYIYIYAGTNPEFVGHLENTSYCPTWPPHLSELITTTFHSQPCVLPTQIAGQTFRYITANFSSRSFSVSAPSSWNSLPARVRSLDKLSTFKRQLKSNLFQCAFAVWWSPCALSVRQIRITILAL